MKRRKSYFKNSGKPPLYVSRYKIHFISCEDQLNPCTKNTDDNRQEVTIIYDNGIDLVIQLKTELEKKSRPLDYKSIPWYLLTDEEVRQDLNERVNNFLIRKKIKKFFKRTKKLVKNKGFKKISTCRRNLIKKILRITSKPREFISISIDNSRRRIWSILKIGMPLFLLVEYILIVLNEKTSRIIQININDETNRNVDFINYTKLIAIMGGLSNCLRGTMDLVEAFVVCDRFCLVLSLIGVTVDILEILISFTDGGNFFVFIAIPLSSMCKIIVWCNRRLIISWGDYTTTLRIMNFKNLKIHLPPESHWRMI